MLKRALRFALIMSYVLISGCDKTVETVPETQSSANAPLLADTLTTARGIRLVSVGKIDGNVHDFTFIGWAGLRRDGTIAVVQDQSAQVVFFGSDGRLLSSVGRLGSGPGEFRRLRYSGWIADTLWVWDNELDRLSWVLPEPVGVARSVRIARVTPEREQRGRLPSFTPQNVLAVYSDGTFLSSGSDRDGATLVNQGSPIFRSTLSGRVKELVGWLPSGQDRARYSNGSVLIPFAPERLSAASPNGDRIVVVTDQTTEGETSSFTVIVLSPTGDTVLHRRYDQPARRIPAARRDSILRVAEARAASIPGALAALRSATIPQHYESITGIHVGRNESIWLRLHAATATGQRQWLLLDAVGNETDTVLLPTNTAVMASDSEYVLIRASDDMDVHSLLLYRIIR